MIEVLFFVLFSTDIDSILLCRCLDDDDDDSGVGYCSDDGGGGDDHRSD